MNIAKELKINYIFFPLQAYGAYTTGMYGDASSVLGSMYPPGVQGVQGIARFIINS